MDYKFVQVFTKKETLILVSFRKSSEILNNILSVYYLERASSDSSVIEVAKSGSRPSRTTQDIPNAKKTWQIFSSWVKGELSGRMTWQFLNALELFSP